MLCLFLMRYLNVVFQLLESKTAFRTAHRGKNKYFRVISLSYWPFIHNFLSPIPLFAIPKLCNKSRASLHFRFQADSKANSLMSSLAVSPIGQPPRFLSSARSSEPDLFEEAYGKSALLRSMVTREEFTKADRELQKVLPAKFPLVWAHLLRPADDDPNIIPK